MCHIDKHCKRDLTPICRMMDISLGQRRDAHSMVLIFEADSSCCRSMRALDHLVDNGYGSMEVAHRSCSMVVDHLSSGTQVADPFCRHFEPAKVALSDGCPSVDPAGYRSLLD